MFAVATIAVLVAMLLAVTRAFSGPTVFDRILAVNTFGTLTVILLSATGFLTGRPDYLDVALVYALINFIATIAVTRYVRFGAFSEPKQSRTLGDGDI